LCWKVVKSDEFNFLKLKIVVSNVKQLFLVSSTKTIKTIIEE